MEACIAEYLSKYWAEDQAAGAKLATNETLTTYIRSKNSFVQVPARKVVKCTTENLVGLLVEI